jgi:hypothetical protein
MLGFKLVMKIYIWAIVKMRGKVVLPHERRMPWKEEM